jgi:hypothetical protein
MTEDAVYTFELEFDDGGLRTFRATTDEAFTELDRIERLGLMVRSIWRDDEPFWGACTDPDIP